MKSMSRQFINIYFAMALAMAGISAANKDYKTASIVVVISLVNLIIAKRLIGLTLNSKSILIREVSDITGLILQSAMIATLLAVIFGWFAGVSVPTITLFIVGILAATLPSGILAVLYGCLYAISKIQKLSGPVNAIDIGSVEYIIGEHNELFNEVGLKVNEIAIGKDLYGFKKGDQTAELTNRKSGKVSASQIESMQVFFAGLMDTKNQPLRDLATNYVDTKSVSSRLTFQSGGLKEILDDSLDLWDHSHVRKLSKNDRELFEDYLKRHYQKGHAVLGLSYQVKGSKHNVFVGAVALEHDIQDDLVSALRGASDGRIKLVVSYDGSLETAQSIVKKIGLGSIINAADIEGRSDSKLVTLIGKNGALVYGLSASQKTKLVAALNSRKKYILACASSAETKKTYSEADILVGSTKIGDLISNIFAGRVNQINMNVVLRSTLASNTASLACVLLSLIILITIKVAPILTAPELLLASILLIVPLIALISDSPRDKYMTAKPKDPEIQIFNPSSFIGLLGFGLIAAALSYSSFIIFFNRAGISPVNLTDLTLPLYHHATTQAFLTLSICTMLFLFFERADNHAKVYSEYLWENKKLLLAIAGSIGLIILAIYTPAGQFIFGTQSLNLIDWLIAIAAGGIYIGLRQIQRYTRKHTRKAVLQLQKELTKPIKF